MMKKIFISLLSVALGFSLVACSSISGNSNDSLDEKYTNLSKDEILKILDEEIQCGNKLETTSEIGITGEIRGFDCYDDYNSERYFFRESNEEINLNMWVSRYGGNSENSIYYIVRNKKWALVVINFVKNKLEKNQQIKIIEPKEVQDLAQNDTQDLAVKQCLEQVTSTVYKYVEMGEEIPKNYAPELIKIIQEDYKDIKIDGGIENVDEIAVDFSTKIANVSKRVNEYCKVHKDAYKQ